MFYLLCVYISGLRPLTVHSSTPARRRRRPRLHLHIHKHFPNLYLFRNIRLRVSDCARSNLVYISRVRYVLTKLSVSLFQQRVSFKIKL